jgi:hypothetical protein
MRTILMILAWMPISESFLVDKSRHAVIQAKSMQFSTSPPSHAPATLLRMATTGEEKAAQLVSGADLEVMLADLDSPLVVDAYATWYDCRRFGTIIGACLSQYEIANEYFVPHYCNRILGVVHVC